jgi:hypothetical protein
LEAKNVIKKKGYHFDHRTAKAAKFFLVCESHIDPDMRVTIPAVMMAKGSSNKESKNRMLQMQVRREVEKNQGIGPPPPKAVAVAAIALLTLSAPLNVTRVTFTAITPNAPLAAVGNDDSLADIIFPSPLRKTHKMSHQEQINVFDNSCLNVLYFRQFGQFAVVLNALDNLARRRVNRLCLTAGILLWRRALPGTLGRSQSSTGRQTQSAMSAS